MNKSRLWTVMMSMALIGLCFLWNSDLGFREIYQVWTYNAAHGKTVPMYLTHGPRARSGSKLAPGSATRTTPSIPPAILAISAPTGTSTSGSIQNSAPRDNGYTTLLEACQRIRMTPEEWNVISAISSNCSAAYPYGPPTPDEIELCRGILIANVEALNLVRLALTQDVIPPSTAYGDIDVGPLQQLKGLSQIVQAEGIIQWKDGKQVECLASLENVQLMGRLIMRANNNLIGPLVGLAISGCGTSTRLDLIGSPEQPENQMENQMSSLLPLMGDGNIMRSSLSSSLDQELFTMKNTVWLNLMKEPFKNPFTFEADNGDTYTYTPIDLLHQYRAAMGKAAYCDAQDVAMQIRIACKAYQAIYGDYPKTLGELVPQFLNAEPLDPHTKKPVVYDNVKHRVTFSAMNGGYYHLDKSFLEYDD